MPEANLTGEVFTLDAAAGFDQGIVRGRVGSGARLNYAARFELCHGLSAELSAEAIAQAAADLGLLWVIAGRAEGEALAAAGVQLDAQATVNLFDRVGLSAEVAAFAEASIAGRLGVGLDARDIALAAADLLSGPALDVFMALLREARIEAGVWGKLSFAAMGQARLNIRGSLADDNDAGFLLEMGAEAGLAAGGGYEFYAGVLLDSPKRFFLAAADIITGTIVEQARPLLPRALHPHLAALEYVLPATLNTAYELAQIATGELAARPERAGEVLADCFLAELQRFMLDKLGLGAATLVARALDDLAQRIAELDLNAGQRNSIASTARTLIAALQGEQLTFATTAQVVPGLAEILEELADDDRAQWRPLLAGVWLSLAAGEAIRRGIVPLHASASAGLVGLQTAAAEAFLVELPETPAIVREELEPLIGAVPDRLDLGTVADYLVETRLFPLIEQAVPDLVPVLQLLTREADASDLLAGVLRGDAGAPYQALRNVASGLFDDLLLDALFPALEDVLPDGRDARIWLDEVARPSLTMLREFALGRVDDLVAGRPVDGETFRTALSLMVGKIVLSNVVVLVDILLDHVTGSVSDAARELSDAVRGDPGHDVVAAAETLAEQLLPPFLPRPTALADAARELAAELLLAVSEATSEEVLTDQRRATTRALTRRILFTVYGEVDPAQPEDPLARIAACAYIPAPDAVADLIVLQTETLADQLAVILPRVTPALERFFLQITDASVQELERAAATGLRHGRDQVVRLARQILVLSRAAQRHLEEAERWAGEKEAQLAAATGALRSSRRRRDILDRLELDGIAEAQRLARNAPGFGLLLPAAQNEALVWAAGTFSVAFSVVRPLLDGALRVLGEIADELADLFGAAADVAGLLADLADAINDRVEEAVDDLANLELPDELSVADVAQAAADVVGDVPLIGDALAAAFGAREGEAAARRERQRALSRRAAKRTANRRTQERLDNAVTKRPAQITICSPQPLADELDDAWAYGDSVPVRIAIRHLPRAPQTALGRTPGPVLLALNGAPVRLRQDAWRHEDGVYRLDHTLDSRTSHLRAGVNVLECSYADSVHAPVRAQVLFLAHVSAVGDDATAEADGDKLAVKAGYRPIDLHRWRVYDGDGRARLKGKLKPGERVELTHLEFAKRKGTPPQPPDCAPTLTVVDHLRRYRGETRPREADE